MHTISKIEDIADEDHNIKDGDRINVPLVINTKIRDIVDGGTTQDHLINENITGNELHLEKYSSQAGKSTNLERFMIE